MPRSGDLRPQDRGASDIRWPTRGLLDYTEPLNDTAVQAGARITNQISAAAQQGGQKASNQTVTQLLQSLGLGSIIGDTATAQLGDYLAQLLTPNSALNASNLWGLLPPQTIGKVPSTAVSSAPANILWNPDFIGAISIAGGGGWSWDSVVYYGTVAGGSAKVTADGIVHALKSNPVQVSGGQTLTVTVPILVTAVTAVGNPLEVDVITYRGDTQTGIHTMAVAAAPASGPTTNWVNPPAGSHATTLSASYPIPTDGTVDGLRLRLVVTDTATAGTVRFGAVTASITGGYLATLEADFADAIKTGDWTPLLNALFGQPAVQPQIQVAAVPTGIPHDNITAPAIGGDDIGNALILAANSMYQGLTNTTDPAAGFAQIANAANNLLTVALNALGIGQTNSHTIAQQAVAKPTWHALDPTVDGTFNLTSNAGAAAPTIPVNYGNSAMSIIPTPNAMSKTSLVWLGYGTTNITGAYVNLYKIDPTTGALTKIWTSANVVSSLPSASAGLGWVYVPMPTLAVAQGDVYMGELVIIGTGTHTMVGLTHWLPANPNIHPQQLGATRAGVVTAPTYETVGAGGTGTGTIVEQHTISASATAVLVDVVTGVVPTSVKWGTAADGSGGTAMTLLAQDVNGGLFFCQYGLMNPVTGTNKNVALAVSGAGAFVAMNSIGYDGVTAFGPSTTANGNSSIAFVNFAAQAGELIHVGLGSANTSTPFSGLSGGTSRYNKPGAGSVNYALVMGDMPGASSGTAQASVGSASWAGAVTRLVGTPGAVPATIASPTYSQTVPWFGLSGLAQASQMAPATEQYSDPGAFTFIIPAWMKQGDLIDLVGVGGGKGGQGEYGTPTAADGGEAGHWNARTLVFGTDIPLSTTQITGVVGSGGAGTVSFFTEGNNGTATTFAANGSTLLTCAPGTLAIAGSNGGSPGAATWPANPNPAAQVYYGGTGAGAGSPGSPPGSGGGGAYPFVVYSGAGAPGGAWVRTRQP